MDREYQKLAGEIGGKSPMITLQQVLQALLAERVSVRNLPLITEAVAEMGGVTQNITLMQRDQIREQ